MTLKSAIKFWVPFGLAEHNRRVNMLNRLGIPWSLAGGYSRTLEMEHNVEACNYVLWPEVLKKPPYAWTLVDVGASKGHFSKAALSLADPECVIVFEPLPSCQAELERNLARSRSRQIIPKAVGNMPGHIELHRTQNPVFSSVLPPLKQIASFYPAEYIEVEEKVRVPLVTLDDALSQVEKIGLMKIDVQGYELSVLEGATQALKRTTAVLIEANYIPHYEGATSFDQIYRFLTGQGFVLAGMSKPYVKRIPLWADAIFVQKSVISELTESVAA